MLVFRYQNEHGVGPFQSALYPDMAAALKDAGWPEPPIWRDVRRPPQWWDELIRPRFGCETLRQLVTWFPRPSRAVLAANGQRLTAFDVPPYRALVGTQHTVFDATAAVEVDPALALERERPRATGTTPLPDPQELFAEFLQSLTV